MDYFKNIIFDFDGTLADTRHIILSTMQATMREMDLNVASDQQCAATIGLPLKDCFKRLYSEMSDQEAQSCAATYCRIFDENKHRLAPSLFPDVAETLSALKSQGATLAVASSRSHQSLMELLKMLGVDHMFALVLGCDNVVHPKPHPEAVVTILRELSVEPSHTLVVGDMPVDIEMGNRAKAHTCGVTWGNATLNELRQSQPTFIINSMKQLVTLGATR